MISESTTNSNFDWIAPIYDTLAFVVFGQRLRRAQAVFLDWIPPNATILIVGGGTGWLLEQVLKRCQPRHVVYLDTSVQMVARASRRIVQRAVLGSVDYRVGNETTLMPTEQFDVILTPFVVDLFSEQVLQLQFIPQLRSVLKRGGLWFITDFVQTSIWWQKLLLWSMIRFFRITAGIKTEKLADWQRILAESGLLRQKQQAQLGGMVSAEVWTTPI